MSSLQQLILYLFLFLFCSETMSTCSQNCWIDWNSVMLCFKWLFPRRRMNICLICEAYLRKFGLVPITAYTCITSFTAWQWKRLPKNSASPHRFGSWPMTRNRRLFWGARAMNPSFCLCTRRNVQVTHEIHLSTICYINQWFCCLQLTSDLIMLLKKNRVCMIPDPKLTGIY